MKYQCKNTKLSKNTNYKKKIRTLILFTILSLLLFIPEDVKAASEMSEKNNGDLYLKIVNNVMSSFKASAKNDDKSILAMFNLNPLNIVKNEISYLENITIINFIILNTIFKFS